MKRVGGLWLQVTEFSNLLAAWRKARRGKAGRAPALRRDGECRRLCQGRQHPGAGRRDLRLWVPLLLAAALLVTTPLLADEADPPQPPGKLGNAFPPITSNVLDRSANDRPTALPSTPQAAETEAAAGRPATAKPPLDRAPNNPPAAPNVEAPDSADAEPNTLSPTSITQACLRRPGEGPELVVIPAGRFRMGSGEADTPADEQPQHWVAVIKPFALARCEVTVGEFQHFVEETGYVTDAELEDSAGCIFWDQSKPGQSKEHNWRSPGFEQADDAPVVCVSWRDASAYAQWLSMRTGVRYRLPSEAEWEYAARAGTTSARFWGDDPDDACGYANGYDQTGAKSYTFWWVGHDCDDGAATTAPVGRYAANAFGLHDMLGNVWEWTQDCWHESYSDAPYDGSAWEDAGSGDCARRVTRGGGWIDGPSLVRSASRSRSDTLGAFNGRGFRLARML